MVIPAGMSSKIQEDDENHVPKWIPSTQEKIKLSSDDKDGDQDEYEDEDDLGLFSTAATGNFSYDDYTVGWICALPMLDEIHRDLKKRSNDNNTYTLGSISGHNIVMTCLPAGAYGIASVASVASQMQASFGSVRFWLMVGIGGGIPSEKTDVRLGDVVVSIPTPNFEGVVQYDYGKTVGDGCLKRTGTLNKPPTLLLTAVAKLRVDHELTFSRIPAFLSEIPDKYPSMAAMYMYCGQQQDLLFAAEYDHVGSKQTCEDCDRSRLIVRSPRLENSPRIHYGLVASLNQSMKNGRTRDRLAQELGILCFEMEAAGLMDNFPCLVIRGICDYADSHKNRKWQGYAAATAAAYTKELLSVIPATSGTSGEQRRFFMGALYFGEIDVRQMTIKTAHAKTCKWLLSEPQYQDWLDYNKISQHHCFLWIKGKPGTGKSTIMKFALNHAKRRKDLERSTIGMCRSLLYQLLEKVPELQNILDPLGSPPESSEYHLWNIEILKNLLWGAIVQLGQRRLMCFIDALDECEEDQVREMVEFFENLEQLSVSARIQLHICFSSRHYPHVTIGKGQQLVLECQGGHNQDIANYLYSELKVGYNKQADEVRMEILEMASGIFLWVVLVVRILNREYERGRTHGLRKKLQEIPTELNNLWRDILIRDNQNMESLFLCIQWILYAKRPLKREELYLAILSGENPQALTERNLENITKQNMERYLLSSSKGLAEVMHSKDQTVRFIHESVQDFLLKENVLRDLWSEFGNKGNNFPSLNFSSWSHEQLKKCCCNYMKRKL
ncbi:hypothetical protein BGW36DRAFT_389823 [Talaromyces proteolyticus]|uniref:Nucleoside phosphorylase domain-containing protein n=1 Tax=Talaromyces proteolyticus TaxID=1131652 RepID=A0AAD4KDT3_9EURO|nr:uncharacterized protein BGW36DRAFT_389823 [Talaromyces proteolyticus]KAH8689852.1 hypothetical protein BGW36DRAFT_389823 [Talaromyces proteolyticus]